MAFPSVQEILNAQLEGTNSGTLRVSGVLGCSFSNITTSAQTVVKGSAGLLHNIIVNAPFTSAFRLYDNTVSGGTIIGTVSANVVAGTTLNYDAKFATGLVVSSGSSDTNLTIMYL